MKKILALLAAFATLFSLSACKMNRELTPEEIAEKESKAVAQSIKAEEDYQAGHEKTVDKLGKTEKGKRLVVQEPDRNGYEYGVYEFDKKEVLKNRYRYLFFGTATEYEQMLKIFKADDYDIVDADKKSRLIIYEIHFEPDPELTFDYLYELNSSEWAKAAGTKIIE